jgi:transposase
MFVRAKKKDEKRWQVQIVESIRKGEKVTQKIVRNVGTAYNQRELNEFKRLGEIAIIEMKNRQKPVLAFADPSDFHAPRKREKQKSNLVDPKDLREEKRINEGFTDIFGHLYEEVGFTNLIGKKKWNDIIQSTVIARIASPRSKLATLKLLSNKFDIKIPFMSIYRAMDYLLSKERAVKKLISQKSLGMFDEKVDVLFFDVTTLYFESVSSDELRDFGFSKDCKFKEVQVMLALITTENGLPITYELFAGNTFEGHTFIKAIEKLRKDFDVENFVFVADRAMFNKDNLEYMENNKIHYIVAAKLKSLAASIQNQILTQQFSPAIVSNEFHWLKEFEYQNRRLIVSYSSKRARKDAADRRRLIDRLLKKEINGKVKIKDLITNYGTKKYIKVTGGEAKINELRIEADAQWDGLHGVITNCSEKSSTKILERYRGLWQIEEAFRVNKHSLKMRPIFHWTPKRIRAHILLCFVAYALTKYATYRLNKKVDSFSIEKLRDILDGTEASIIIDLKTSNRFVIPSKLTEEMKKTYSIFGLKRSDVPYSI